MQYLVHVHSILRWVIVVFAVLVLINSFFGMRSKGLFTKMDNNLSKYLMLSTHLMLVIGLIQYFLGNKGFAFIKEYGMKGIMASKAMRFHGIEHITTMIIAIILITMGRALGRRKEEASQKHKTIFWYTLIAFVLMMVRIPWPWMDGAVAGGWY
jgi:cytochrome bd-type quinol oxidase subunit 2